MLVVLGSIIALLGAVLLAAGDTLLWADRSERDDDGFLTTPTEPFERDSYAIVSDDIDFFEAETGSDWILSENVLGDVRLRAANVEEGEVFVGVGPTSDVENYLAGVEHDEVTDLDFDPFSAEYRRLASGEPAGPPTEQTSGRRPRRAREPRPQPGSRSGAGAGATTTSGASASPASSESSSSSRASSCSSPAAIRARSSTSRWVSTGGSSGSRPT